MVVVVAVVVVVVLPNGETKRTKIKRFMTLLLFFFFIHAPPLQKNTSCSIYLSIKEMPSIIDWSIFLNILRSCSALKLLCLFFLLLFCASR